jgi:hypothetical protein
MIMRGPPVAARSSSRAKNLDPAVLAMPSLVTDRQTVSTESPGQSAGVASVRIAGDDGNGTDRRSGSASPGAAPLPTYEAFVRSLARQDQAASRPTIVAADVVAKPARDKFNQDRHSTRFR